MLLLRKENQTRAKKRVQMRLMRKENIAEKKTPDNKINQSKMNHKLKSSILFNSNKLANQALKSIKPETIDTDRTKTKLEVKGKELIINVKAKDVTALRAAINTFLRLVKTVK